MTSLEGKRAIITGAGSGIGRASALAFARAGARVLVTDVNKGSIDETCSLVTAAGGQVMARVMDVADPAQIDAAVTSVQQEWGGLDILFANAGIGGDFRNFDEIDVEAWLDVLRVNLVGVAMCVQRAALAMREGEGDRAILCTASVAGLRSGAGPTPYSASKAGVINLVQTVANQLSGSGIRINAICPGLIETGMTQPTFDAARAAGKGHKLGQLNPLRRAGVPDDIAGVACFLVSEGASYVNGQAIAVDGGLSSSLPVVPGRVW